MSRSFHLGGAAALASHAGVPCLSPRWFLLRLAAWLTLPLSALATEHATVAFPSGADDFLIAGMPPPGLYGWVYYNHYQSNYLANNSGQMALQNFNLKADVVAIRFDYVRPVSLLGADRLGFLFFLPIANLNLTLSPAPGVLLKGSNSGVGDFTISPGLHWTFKNYEMVNAFDVSMPTGAYDKTNLVNVGLNRWVLRLQHMGTWHPTPAWDISYRLLWDYNFANPDTHYLSGQIMFFDWGIGWKPTPPLTIGVVGYFLRQLTSDKVNGSIVGSGGGRVRVDGIGPGVKYFLPNHVILSARYFREFDARNHPRGDVFWCSVTVPFGPKPPGH